jgi:heterotetrameric sarcosine oxidase gamma subunit
MADPASRRHPFGADWHDRRSGRADGAPGIVIRHVGNRTQAEIAAFAIDDPLLETALGVTRAKGRAHGFRSSPQRAFIVAKDDDLIPVLAGLATPDRGAVIDQSDGRVAIRVTGPRVEDVLSKLFAVDVSLPRIT